jgi:hypothetical protein
LGSHGGTGDTEGEAGDCQSQFLISDFYISVTLCLCEILPGRGRSLDSHGGTGDTEGEAGDCQSQFLISDFFISVTLCLCEILPWSGQIRWTLTEARGTRRESRDFGTEFGLLNLWRGTGLQLDSLAARCDYETQGI